MATENRDDEITMLEAIHSALANMNENLSRMDARMAALEINVGTVVQSQVRMESAVTETMGSVQPMVDKIANGGIAALFGM